MQDKYLVIGIRGPEVRWNIYEASFPPVPGFFNPMFSLIRIIGKS